MKFDPFAWHEVKPNEDYEAPKGRLRLLCSKASPLYISAVGVEALAGVSTSFDLEISGQVTFCLDADPGTRVFVHIPRNAVQAPVTGAEVFTNADRMPLESGTVLEVKRALRELQLAQREQLAEMRGEARKLRAERQAHLRALAAPKAAEPAPTDDNSGVAE